MIKAVIFDMDGVIVDSEPLNKSCLREFLLTLGVKLPHDLPDNVQGLNTKAYWTIIKKTFDIDLSVEELSSRWRPYYLNYLSDLPEIPVIPGIPELTSYLDSAGYRLAIASSANPKRIKLILDKINLEYSFSTIIHGDSYEASKPAPDCFLLAAQRLNTPIEECVVIEDSTNGVRAAKAANMRCIGYAGSDHNNDDLSEADIIITDFKALASSLQEGKPWPL